VAAENAATRELKYMDRQVEGMAQRVDVKLENVKAQLRKIIVDIENLAQYIQYSSEGIGTDICAAKMRAVANEYRVALSNLNKVDLSEVGIN